MTAGRAPTPMNSFLLTCIQHFVISVPFMPSTYASEAMNEKFRAPNFGSVPFEIRFRIRVGIIFQLRIRAHGCPLSTFPLNELQRAPRV